MSDKNDETSEFIPKWDQNGLMAAIAQDYQTKDILMLAWINQEALTKSLETGEAHYWSRSRQELWHKGATSGNIQKIHDIIIDCDQDAIIYLVDQIGGSACHTGRRSCFYRQIDKDGQTLRFMDQK